MLNIFSFVLLSYPTFEAPEFTHYCLLIFTLSYNLRTISEEVNWYEKCVFNMQDKKRYELDFRERGRLGLRIRTSVNNFQLTMEVITTKLIILHAGTSCYYGVK